MSNVYCLVIGAGVFGVTGAIELAQRGRRVTLVDPGPIPHVDAASTDISKIIRPDYGADSFYCELMEHALRGWRAYNQRWPEPLFHEHGFSVLSSAPLEPGTFEGDSFTTLRERGFPVQRLDARAMAARFGLWRQGVWIDGYYNPHAGWAESGRVVAALVDEARARGVEVREGVACEALLQGSRETGVRLSDGSEIRADVVIVAAGAWTPTLLPELSDQLMAVGQPVVHFRPERAERFSSPGFVPWAGDIQRRGFYGFPVNRDGIVKVANHGKGTAVDARDERVPPSHTDALFRGFLRQTLPALADAPIVGRRLCLYCDSKDGDFLIARHPRRHNVVVAAGGSGHGFKFAPILGRLIADAVDESDSPWGRRFAWRDMQEAHEDARCVE